MEASKISNGLDFVRIRVASPVQLLGYLAPLDSDSVIDGGEWRSCHLQNRVTCNIYVKSKPLIFPIVRHSKQAHIIFSRQTVTEE